MTGRRETGRKETGRKGTGGKTTGAKERGVGETGGKKNGVGETGGKEKGVGQTGGKTTGVKEREVGETRAKEWEVGETGAKETGGKGSGQNVMEGIERKSYSAAVIEGVRKRARVFVGDSIVRKTDRVLNKGDDVVVCLPGVKIEAITERVKNIVGSGKGGSVLVHVGTNNVEREGTTAIVRKYRQLVRTLKQTRVEQVILSGILPVMGRRGHKYRNCRGMAINMLVQKLCREEEVGFVDLWGSFVLFSSSSVKLFCFPCSFWQSVIAHSLHMSCPSHSASDYFHLKCFFVPISSLDFFIFLLSSWVALHILRTQLFSAICNFSCLSVSASVPNPYIQTGTTQASNTPFSCFFTFFTFLCHKMTSTLLCISLLLPPF